MAKQVKNIMMRYTKISTVMLPINSSQTNPIPIYYGMRTIAEDFFTTQYFPNESEDDLYQKQGNMYGAYESYCEIVEGCAPY